MYHNLEIEELRYFTKNLKVLYAEDNKDVRNAFKGLLDNFFDDITIAIDGLDGLHKFENNTFDLVISDLKMPKMNGIEMIRKIKKLDKSISVIVTTAHKETEYLIDSIEIGVDRYLLKPISHTQLQEIIMQVCEKIYYLKKNKEYEDSLEELVKKRTLELENSQKKLLNMANKDYMTNLYNRRYLNEVLDILIKLSHREQKKFSLLMIDIDKFKAINDHYGHIAGDKIIIFVAKTLLQLTRESDIVVRFGGDEFIIILPNTKIKDASLIANNIRTTIENKEIDSIENIKLNFTISVGISQFDYSSNQNIDSLLHKADQALYKAKQNGKNEVVLYNEEGV